MKQVAARLVGMTALCAVALPAQAAGFIGVDDFGAAGGVAARVAGGDFNFSVDNGVAGSFVIRWDGSNDVGFDGFDLAADLSSVAASAATVDSDLPGEITVRVYSDADNWAELSRSRGVLKFVGDLLFPVGVFSGGRGHGRLVERRGRRGHWSRNPHRLRP